MTTSANTGEQLCLNEFKGTLGTKEQRALVRKTHYVESENDVPDTETRIAIIGDDPEFVLRQADRFPDYVVTALQEGFKAVKKDVDWHATYPLTEIADYWWIRYPAEEVHERVARMWDWSSGLPFAKFPMRCFICGSSEVLAKRWSWVKNTGRTIQHHCDAFYGCMVCSNHWVFGVPCPPDVEPYTTGIYIYHRDLR